MKDNEVNNRIEEIRSLMYKGNRSGINSGTALIIWGAIALISMEVTPMFFLNGWFDTTAGSVTAALIFKLIIITSGILLDYKLTEKKAEELGEVLDFTTRQVSKIWIFVLGFAIYLTMVLAAKEVYEYIYPVWMILVGIGIYFCGLFSLKYYERYGLLLITAGLLCTFVPEPYIFLAGKRIAEVVIGIGLIASGIYVKKRYGW